MCRTRRETPINFNGTSAKRSSFRFKFFYRTRLNSLAYFVKPRDRFEFLGTSRHRIRRLTSDTGRLVVSAPSEVVPGLLPPVPERQDRLIIGYDNYGASLYWAEHTGRRPFMTRSPTGFLRRKFSDRNVFF